MRLILRFPTICAACLFLCAAALGVHLKLAQGIEIADATPRTAAEFEAESEGEGGRKGPELEQYYFEKWHQRDGSMLPAGIMEETWKDIFATRSEGATPAGDSWISLGPVAMNSIFAAGTRYTGRILDLGLTPSGLRVAGASGGLWQRGPVTTDPLSDGITSLAVGSFATQPGNDDLILVGTGEPFQRSGTGLWRTTDGGVTWNQVPMAPPSSSFYKIRFTPDNPNEAHAATNSGYYRSDDAGLTWTRYRTGACTDLAITSNALDIVYTVVYSDGLYVSSNGGNTWTKVTSPGIPTTNVGRGAITMDTDPAKLYVSLSRLDDHHTLGVFKTTDGGTSWSTVSPPGDFLGGQGWYDNVIGTAPGNFDLVLVGGITVWRTTNGGSSWAQINDPDLHVDHHVIMWTDGSTVYEGNDGGLSRSTDGGLTWDTSLNAFPLTQYVNFGVGVSDHGVLGGGSQDNGFSVTADGGATWDFTFGGDGGSITVDPNDASRIWGTLGVYGGSWAFRRHRSLDTGRSWNNGINGGIAPSGQWYTKIRNDGVAPVWLYTNSGPWVYRSTNDGNLWTALNPVAFPSEIYNLTVSRRVGGNPLVYACLSSVGVGQQLRVYDDGVWYERSSGLAPITTVRGVTPHPVDIDKAYAVMAGFTPAQKVFKTTDRGLNWTNLSGNLPNVPMGDLVVHPEDDDQLFVGTEFGCYRTTDGGESWERWNSGMPEAAIVTEMASIDRRAIDGTFHVLAATYGRGIWSRQVTGSPAGVADASAPPQISGLGSYPNPFSRTTTIAFRLTRPAPVDMQVYDVSGRMVARLLNATVEAGRHTVEFDASKLPLGVYACRLRAGSNEETLKLTVIK